MFISFLGFTSYGFIYVFFLLIDVTKMLFF